MAQTKSVALKWGHPTPFRRTIDLGTEKKPDKVQLVFEPGVKYQLTAREIKLLEHDFASEMLVFPDKDPKRRWKDSGNTEPAEPERTATETPEPAESDAE